MSSAGDLPDIRALRPESYVTRERLWSGEPVPAFTVHVAEDSDWLERMILEQCGEFRLRDEIVPRRSADMGRPARIVTPTAGQLQWRGAGGSRRVPASQEPR